MILFRLMLTFAPPPTEPIAAIEYNAVMLLQKNMKDTVPEITNIAWQTTQIPHTTIMKISFDLLGMSDDDRKTFLENILDKILHSRDVEKVKVLCDDPSEMSEYECSVRLKLLNEELNVMATTVNNVDE